jgi:hypothetical protein
MYFLRSTEVVTQFFFSVTIRFNKGNFYVYIMAELGNFMENKINLMVMDS